ALGAERPGGQRVRVAALADLATAALATAARTDPAAEDVQEENEDRSGDGNRLRALAPEEDAGLVGDRSGDLCLRIEKPVEHRGIERQVHHQLVRLPARAELTAGELLDGDAIELQRPGLLRLDLLQRRGSPIAARPAEIAVRRGETFR